MTKTRSRNLLSQNSRFARNALSAMFQFGDTINGASGFHAMGRRRTSALPPQSAQQPKSHPRGLQAARSASRRSCRTLISGQRRRSSAQALDVEQSPQQSASISSAIHFGCRALPGSQSSSSSATRRSRPAAKAVVFLAGLGMGPIIVALSND